MPILIYRLLPPMVITSNKLLLITYPVKTDVGT